MRDITQIEEIENCEFRLKTSSAFFKQENINNHVSFRTLVTQNMSILGIFICVIFSKSVTEILLSVCSISIAIIFSF